MEVFYERSSFVETNLQMIPTFFDIGNVVDVDGQLV